MGLRDVNGRWAVTLFQLIPFRVVSDNEVINCAQCEQTVDVINLANYKSGVRKRRTW